MNTLLEAMKQSDYKLMSEIFDIPYIPMPDFPLDWFPLNDHITNPQDVPSIDLPPLIMGSYTLECRNCKELLCGGFSNLEEHRQWLVTERNELTCDKCSCPNAYVDKEPS